MKDPTETEQERTALLEKLLEEERSKTAYYKELAEEKERQHLREISELSEALTKHRETARELRESEERYRIVMEHSHDGVAIIKENMHIYASRRLAEIFGYDKPGDIIEKPSTLIVHPDDQERVSNFMIGRQRGGSTPSRFEFRGRRRDGATVYIEAAMTMIAYRDENLILAYFRDITGRRRMEEELLKASKLESLGVLAGGIAHDFNNIMTAIIGNVSLAKLTTKPDDPSYKRLIGAEGAVMRAKDLTQQLLTFSKGGTPIKRTTGIVHIVEDSTNFALTGSNVGCFFSMPEDLWNVDVDEGQMSQVMQNLVINAKESMSAGGTMEVRAENITVDDEYVTEGMLPRKGAYVKVSIKDHGIGIPEELIDKIFDPFFTTKQKGSGLGLATSYSIVKKHGGFIQAKSHLGIGTTFSIYLPATQKKKFPFGAPKSEIAAGKGKILLMDDEEIIRDTIGEMLSVLGYETGLAKDGVEAIDLYVEAQKNNRPFDVVILDLTVPGGMGGQEAMEEFLEIDPKIKAVVSSGYANNLIMSDFAHYGFIDVISKPYRLEELSETISRVMGKAH